MRIADLVIGDLLANDDLIAELLLTDDLMPSNPESPISQHSNPQSPVNHESPILIPQSIPNPQSPDPQSMIGPRQAHRD
jgi:hypothetical protein